VRHCDRFNYIVSIRVLAALWVGDLFHLISLKVLRKAVIRESNID
jgi:hypothetical protein